MGNDTNLLSDETRQNCQRPWQFGLEGLLAWTALVASILLGIKANSAWGILPLIASAGWIVVRGLTPKIPSS